MQKVPIEKEVFVCIDCESTGTNVQSDRIVEIAVVRFTFHEILESFSTLINPQMPIPSASQEIHKITDEMVANSPTLDQVLDQVISLCQDACYVGHSIGFDLALLTNQSQSYPKPFVAPLEFIDTLRLARLYGKSPENSLAALRRHLQIPFEQAHRALNDVLVNIEVFKKLSVGYGTLQQLFEKLSKPILLEKFPFGKNKGRTFAEIPLPFLRWAVSQNFDGDLLFSLRHELKKRNEGSRCSYNPFQALE